MRRKSPISGSWYEGTEKTLRKQIEAIYLNTEFGPGKLPSINSEDAKITGVIVPHAGFVYSGYTAAHSYLALREITSKISTAIILGPNHTGLGSPLSTSKHTWETPLGDIDIDPRIHSTIADIPGSLLTVDETAHAREHSIEIQLPFLQYTFPELEYIFPICMGSQYEYTAVAELLHKVIEKLGSAEIAIIASSDLSHENSYDLLEKNDETMLGLIAAGNARDADKFRKQVNMTMCGYGPVFTLLELRRLRGNPGKITKLHYSNSSQIMNNYADNQYRVGYSAFSVDLS